MSELISPIKYGPTELLGVSFRINPAFEADLSDHLDDTENELGVKRATEHARTDDELYCKCLMQVRTVVKANARSDSDDVEDAGDEILSFVCTMSAEATSPEMAEDEALSEAILEANTITYIWGKMRNWMELLTADSILAQRISLPAIDPYSLLEDVDEETDSQEAE